MGVSLIQGSLLRGRNRARCGALLWYGMTPWAQRPSGIRLIIVYKLVRAPLMLAVAVWLTVAPGSVHRVVAHLAQELAEAGATWARAGAWLDAHDTSTVTADAAALAWLDTAMTSIEGLLLLSGRPWAEWVVIAGLGALIPLELLSLEHRPAPGKWLVLLVNALIVGYLALRRVLLERGQAPG